MRKLANALAATFDPPKSVPYERSQQVEMEGGRSPNPLQSRKLYTSTS
jgi:hypothetical protein